MAPQIIFGTATFGMDASEFQDISSILPVLQLCKDAGIKRLDSGARYPPRNPGRAEELIGEASKLGPDFAIDTKVYTDTQHDGSGDLLPQAIDTSFSGSLARLGEAGRKVNVLHIHRADATTPLRDQIAGFNQQIDAGRCQAWGVSNVPVSMLEEMLKICEAEGLRKPVCYQGEYNIVTRGMETLLLPLLRKHGMVFNAFRPLAAGFLTGKLLKADTAGTRFGDDNPMGQAFQKLYGADGLHKAIRELDEKASASDLSTLEVAMRWLVHHSALQDSDGIILGASKFSQAVENATMIKRGPLPGALLASVEELWDATQLLTGQSVRVKD